MDLPLVRVPDRGFTSFVNAPVVTDLAALEADVAILGVPYGIPYEMGQCRSFGAPGYIREKSLRFAGLVPPAEFAAFHTDARGRGARLVDCGDVPGDPMDMRGNVDRATDAVRAILARGAVPIVLGGDDAIPIPVVRAYRDFGPLVVIQIDQHFDLGDEVNGVRDGYCSTIRRIADMPWVARIIQIGQQGDCAVMTRSDATGRGEGPALVLRVDRDQPGAGPLFAPAAAAGATVVTAREVHEQGIGALLARVPQRANYFITLDFDGLDAAVCPAVSHPEPGGLTWSEAVALLRGLAAQGRIAGMDLVEMVPDHDHHGLGGHTAARLILTLIGAMIESGQFEHT